MKTIARNRSTLLDEIFRKATYCLVFSEANSFQGKECASSYAKKEFYRYDFSRMRTDKPGLFIVNVHHNLWFEIKSPVNLPGM